MELVPWQEGRKWQSAGSTCDMKGKGGCQRQKGVGGGGDAWLSSCRYRACVWLPFHNVSLSHTPHVSSDSDPFSPRPFLSYSDRWFQQTVLRLELNVLLDQLLLDHTLGLCPLAWTPSSTVIINAFGKPMDSRYQSLYLSPTRGSIC